MKLALAAVGVATLVGVGYVIGRKIFESKSEDEDFCDFDCENCELGQGEDNPDVGVYAKTKTSGKYKQKIRNASLFAVGAIKTGADKIGETFNDIKTKDMVKKGEKTVEAVKETGGNLKNDIKRDIDGLKHMVSSIEDEAKESQAFDAAENIAENISDGIADGTDSVFRNSDEQ